MSDPIRITSKLKGSAAVVGLLRRFPEKISRTMLSLVKQEARGMAVEIARNTRPYGFSETARKRGEKAVAGDINKVFVLPSDAYEQLRKTDPVTAERFWAHVSNRRFSRASKTLAASSSSWNQLTLRRLDPRQHQQSRTGPNANVTRKQPAQIVTSAKARDNYIAKIQKRVGFAKGSWLNAAKSIGGRVRGAAQWATRHKQAPGTAIVKSGESPSVTLVNRLDYIHDVTTTTAVEIALRVASIKLRKALATSLRMAAEKASRSMRRTG